MDPNSESRSNPSQEKEDSCDGKIEQPVDQLDGSSQSEIPPVVSPQKLRHAQEEHHDDDSTYCPH